VACQVGRDVTQALEWRTFTYDHYQYLGEFERMLGMAGHLRFGIGPNTARVSNLHLEFAAHLLNAAGICTARIKKLSMADRSGRFRWESPVGGVEPKSLGYDSADEFEPDQSGPVAAPNVPRVPVVPFPPVTVPVKIGVGAGQQQVVTVPTRDTELEFIRQHVGVYNAPRGKKSVHRRNGSILKVNFDPKVLFRHVLDHVPDWRD